MHDAFADLQRLTDVADSEIAAAEADRMPARKFKQPKRDLGPALDKQKVLAKLGKASEANELQRFAAALASIEAPYLKRVNWVANHLHMDLADIADDEPPDYASLCLLKWANSNEDAFRATYDSRLMPTKNELASAEKSKDDGRALTLLDSFEKDFYATSAARPDGEREVSPAGNQAGEREQVGAGGDSAGRGA